MTTAFPGSVDSLTNPVAGDTLASPSHAAQHANANDAIEAIEGYLRRTFDVRHFGAVGNGISDDTASFQAALTAAAPTQGSVVLPEGCLRVTSKITVPKGVSLIGQGRGGLYGRLGTTILLDHSSAYLEFAEPSFATISGFTVDGASKATKGIYALFSTQSSWRDVAVIYVVGDGFRANNIQNATLVNIGINNCTRGFWLDDGAGSITVIGLQSANNTEYNLKLGSSGTSSSMYLEPTMVTFVGPVLEWNGYPAPPGTDVVACVVVEGAARATFINGVYVTPNNPGVITSGTRPMFKVSVEAPATESSLIFLGANKFYASAGAGFWLDDASSVEFIGHQNVMDDALTGVAFLSAGARLTGDLTVATITDGNAYTFAGGANPDDAIVSSGLPSLTDECLPFVDTFFGPTADWTKAGGASHGTDYGCQLPSGGSISHAITAVAGVQYVVTVTCTYSTGTVTPSIGAVNGSADAIGVGDHSWLITAGASGSLTFALAASGVADVLVFTHVHVRRWAGGAMLSSPNGHRWRQTITDAGTAAWTDVDA